MINNSYLLGLFGGSAPMAADTSMAALLNRTTRKQPTPPWSTNVEPPKQDALVRAALGGRKFINEDAAQLDVKTASADYRKLFALYQGLDTLNALVKTIFAPEGIVWTMDLPAEEFSLESTGPAG